MKATYPWVLNEPVALSFHVVWGKELSTAVVAPEKLKNNS